MQNYLHSEIYRTFENNHEITCKLSVCRLPISFDQATPSFVQDTLFVKILFWINLYLFVSWLFYVTLSECKNCAADVRDSATADFSGQSDHSRHVISSHRRPNRSFIKISAVTTIFRYLIDSLIQIYKVYYSDVIFKLNNENDDIVKNY